MKKLVFFILLFCFASSIQSQVKYDYTWIFGNPDFNGNSVSFHDELLLDTVDIFMSTGTSYTNISDKEGNLLFYTNGCLIADASHNLMLNGDSLISSGFFYDATCAIGNGMVTIQSCLALPMPQNDSLYYLFHQPREVINFDAVNTSFQYVLINMNLNNGLGAVVEKNIPIREEPLYAGNLTAVKHSNNEDWWILLPKIDTNIFYNILLTSEGIIDTFHQAMGYINTNAGEGASHAVFSPDGTMYARYSPGDELAIFDFDRSTGLLSNYRFIEIEEEADFGSLSISPSSQYLYLSNFLELFQFDLWAADIESSKILIDTFDGFTSPFPTTLYQMQLGPDCKIYMNSHNGVDVLHVINNPDAQGLNCDFVQHGIQLPSFNNASMPNYPNFRLGTGEPVCDPNITTSIFQPFIVEASPKIYPNPSDGHFFIDYKNTGKQCYFKMYDALGRMVFSTELAQGQDRHELFLDKIENGIYFYTMVEDGERIDSGKLVIRE